MSIGKRSTFHIIFLWKVVFLLLRLNFAHHFWMSASRHVTRLRISAMISRCQGVRMLWLIDENGERRSFPGVRSECFSGLQMTQDQCLEYAVRNLGYAVLRRRRSGIELSWRPEIITDITLAGILYEVSDFADDALATRWYRDPEWRFRVLPADRFARIDAIGALVRTERHRIGDRVVYKRLDLDDLLKCSVFAPLLKCWKDAGVDKNRLLTDHFRQYLASVSGGKYCYVRLQNATDSHPLMTLDELGWGFPRAVVDFLSPVVGRPVLLHKDSGFGEYVFHTYAEAASHEQPSAHFVDAVIESSTSEAVRRRYRRLILPFRDQDGQPLMAGISTQDASIDLR